jgi:succinylglutamic semialdehyde dehydrogenase
MKIKPRDYKGDYIQGHFTKVDDPNGEIWSKNPGDLDAPALTFPFSYEHLHDAVTAAKRGFSTWKRQTVQSRTEAIVRYREVLKTKKTEIAYWAAFETGKPLWEANQEVDETISLIDYFITQGSQTSVEQKNSTNDGDCIIRHFSRGVVAIITPASQPILFPHSYFIPALLNGNTAVLKICAQSPMLGQLLSEVTHESGISAGVLNLIHGDAESSRRLVTHSGVDAIFYHGPFETAAKVKKQLLSDFWKYTVIETGGKNAQVVWEDCHYSQALYETLFSSFLTSGQRCSSTSRILVHDKIFDKFLKDFHLLAKKITVGFGLSETHSPFMGPLMSERAVEDYLRFQGIAIREGAEEVMRGKTLERDKKGFYVSPSIHIVEKVDAKSIYQKSEIHGPNVAIFRVKDLDETAEIINQPQWGLVASIYSGSREHFYQLADEVKVGMLHWNRPTTSISYRLPSGGINKSGNERPMGSFAGLQCTQMLSCLENPSPFDINQLVKELPRLEP